MTSRYGADEGFGLTDALWQEVAKLLPAPKLKKCSGRPRMDDRKAMTAIAFVLRTGIQWKALPRGMGAASTVHDRFQEWREAGVFVALWQAGLEAYDEAIGIDWAWQAMDGTMTKAPLGGKRHGAESDRPCQAGDEAQPARRRRRDAAGHYRGWRESA